MAIEPDPKNFLQDLARGSLHVLILAPFLRDAPLDHLKRRRRYRDAPASMAGSAILLDPDIFEGRARDLGDHGPRSHLPDQALGVRGGLLRQVLRGEDVDHAGTVPVPVLRRPAGLLEREHELLRLLRHRERPDQPR
jgi:hypothetical protein